MRRCLWPRLCGVCRWARGAREAAALGRAVPARVRLAHGVLTRAHTHMHTRQLQLLAKQRSRMAEILKHLLPSDMVEMVLSIHFKTGNEALPITLCRCPPPPNEDNAPFLQHMHTKWVVGVPAWKTSSRCSSSHFARAHMHPRARARACAHTHTHTQGNSGDSAALGPEELHRAGGRAGPRQAGRAHPRDLQEL